MKSVPKKRTVLKLMYHTYVFGPIDLEYDRPVIRVGSSEDNDLVLRHPSVEPHHCLLVFRGEKVLCLPPSQVIDSHTVLGSLTGPELGAGDRIKIGELQFNLAHSSKTVAVPGVDGQGSPAGVSTGNGAAGPGEEAGQRHYYCAHCQAFVQDTRVKRLGLVGHAKRNLCPKCSHPLETDLASEKPSPEVAGRKFR
ncbi:MAG: Inner rane component of cytoplasmic domain [Verrucomicrobiota bacterium]